MRAKYGVLLCVSIIIIGLGGRHGRAASPAPDGHAGVHHAQRGAALPLLVDGALTPEQVPDAVAYRHFISVTAVSATASTAADRYRRDALLEQAGLSAADRASYLAAITNVKDSLQAIDQRMQVTSDVPSFDALKQQRRDLLDAAAARIRASLSADGTKRLQKHIDANVKKRIRIYGQ
jgi:hypothetical protein